jgi:hypothetical protein
MTVRAWQQGRMMCVSRAARYRDAVDVAVGVTCLLGTRLPTLR